MERTIKFRGYNLKNKKWLYGYYLVNRGKHYIVQDEVVDPFAEKSDFEVDPESVGQYVGDYKGNAIFEGDMVEVVESDGYKSQYTGTVIYDIMDCRFNVVSKGRIIPLTGEERCMAIGMERSCRFFYKYKVIGNDYEENIKGYLDIEKKVLDDWHKLDEEIFSKQHELIMENRKR